MSAKSPQMGEESILPLTVEMMVMAKMDNT